MLPPRARQDRSRSQAGSPVERRNRAMVALSALTAARANALASMRLKHIDLEAGRIIQDARQVRTKFSKSFPTYFVPIGGNALAIVEDWVNYLNASGYGVPTIRCFPRRGSISTRSGSLPRPASIGNAGEGRRRFAAYSATPSRRQARPTATRTRSGTCSLGSASRLAGRLRISRRSHKTSATTRC
jgi:hypothetical protein